MPQQNTQMKNMGVVRYSNEEAKRITKECIETALFQLLYSKDISKISISELVKKAGVSRTAFYAHYISKEDVIRQALEKKIIKIDKIVSDDPRTVEYWKTIFEEHEKVVDVYRLLLKTGMGQDILMEMTKAMLKNVDHDLNNQYREIIWIGAIYNVISNWIVTDPLVPADKMAEICSNIINFQ